MAEEETTKESARRSTKKSTGGSTKKSTTKKSGGATRARKAQSGGRSGNSAPRAASSRKKTAAHIASAAARQLLELTGREAEGVTGLERTDDGWTVRVEVVEVRRIPETTDVLALYEVEVDDDGDMTGYHRVRRYARGAAGED